MRDDTTLPLLLLILACGCGGSTPAPADPTQSTEPAATAEPPAPAPAASAPSKIDFPPHAGVEAAIKAVPQGAPRLNMSDDALQKPLMDLKRYEKCKIPHAT